MLQAVAERCANCRDVPSLPAKPEEGCGTVNANQMKHAANLAAWKERIVECRASGIPVKVWCEQKGLFWHSCGRKYVLAQESSGLVGNCSSVRKRNFQIGAHKVDQVDHIVQISETISHSNDKLDLVIGCLDACVA